MKKALSMVLVLAMVFSAMLGVMSFAEDAGALVITHANLEFADNVYLLLAVDYSAVGSADGITLKIKNNKTGDETTIDAPATDIDDVPAGCLAFKYDDIGAKNMGDELTIQACLNGSASGDPLTYSILEYALRAESLGDAKLTALVKSMIKYGAEAQKAWSHEGTYDLANKHGMVIVGGATKETRKTIAEVGTIVSPVMNADAFPAGAELYGINFEKADSVAVTEGVSRYFYFGTDIYGDKFGDATTATDNIATNLDFDKYTRDPKTALYDRDHIYPENSPANDPGKYSGQNVIRIYEDGNMSLGYGARAGWSATNSNVWQIYSNTAKANVTVSSDYKGGKLFIDKGYFLIDCYSEYINEETGKRYPTVGYTLSENYNYNSPLPTKMHDPDNFIKDGKFTIGFTVAKKADVDFVTGSLCYIGTSASDYFTVFQADGATLKYGDTVIVNLKEFSGDAPTQSDFTTFYTVFDVNAKTITVHREDGISITLPIRFKKTVTDMVTWLGGEDTEQGFFWNIPGSSGEAYINRITFMVGDVFA